MRRIITINAVIACCLAVMMLLGCETPELPMEVVFSESEIACLQNFTEYSQRAVPHDLQSVVVIMAVIAGYPNRKHDLPPGHQKIRERHIQLSNMILSARIFAAAMHDCEARMHEKFRSGSGSRSVRTNH